MVKNIKSTPEPLFNKFTRLMHHCSNVKLNSRLNIHCTLLFIMRVQTQIFFQKTVTFSPLRKMTRIHIGPWPLGYLPQSLAC